MTHAVEMLEHRHARFVRYALDERPASSGHQEIDKFLQPREFADNLAVGGLHEDHGIGIDPGLLEPLRDACGDGTV